MIFTRVFSKIEFFLKNFSEFTGKDLSQSLFFNKIAGLAIGKDVLLWIYKFFQIICLQNAFECCSIMFCVQSLVLWWETLWKLYFVYILKYIN